jgi:DNA mismatch repair protein MSH3
MQVAQLVLLAQAGCWVPADSMRLTVMDAIHTRMGAHDSILQGRSTFLEELLDTSRLLAAATSNSLVVLDELGRGTATHDGVAIAVATMEHLVLNIRSCCLFVTHYPEVPCHQLCLQVPSTMFL